MTSLHCPTCGHDLDAPPSVASLASARLRPQDRKIVDALSRAYPRAVRTSALVDALYGDDPNGGPEDPSQVIAVRIYTLRRLLPQFGWTVPNAKVGRGNYGEYRLEKIGSARR